RLGGRRRRQLVEARQQTPLKAPFTARGGGVQRIPAKPAFELVEYRPVVLAQLAPGPLQRPIEQLPVLGCMPADPGVGAVDRVVHDECAQAAADGAEGDVPGGRAAAGQTQQATGHYLEIRRQGTFEYHGTRLALFLTEVSRPAGERTPQLRQFPLTVRIVLQQGYPIHEVVAGSTVHLPVVRQALTVSEVLLDLDGEGAMAGRQQAFDPPSQPPAIGPRVGQTI